MKRICIYPKDLCTKLGLGERKAQRAIQDARIALSKKKHQYLTVREFCAYADLDEDLFDDLK